MSNKRLTDAEIARKFNVRPGELGFETAKALAHHRPDRGICDLPMVTCPHCDQEWQKEDYYDVKAGDEWECPLCERTIYVECVDTIIQVTLSTRPQD